MTWVDIVSLGNVALSTSNTVYPLRASNIAVGDPAQRAPTTITSYIASLLSMRITQSSRAMRRVCACCARAASTEVHNRWLTARERDEEEGVRFFTLAVSFHAGPW